MVGYRLKEWNVLAIAVGVLLMATTLFGQQSTTGPEPPKGIDLGLLRPAAQGRCGNTRSRAHGRALDLAHDSAAASQHAASKTPNT